MKEITKPQLCVCIRNGIEIWLDTERAKKVQQILEGIKDSRHIQIDNTSINTADIIGIFTPDQIFSRNQKARGLTQCDYGTWHRKNDICECGRQYLR